MTINAAPEIPGMTSADLLEGLNRFETPFGEYLGARVSRGWQATSQMMAGRFLEREGEQIDPGVGAEMGAPGEAFAADPADIRAQPGMAPSGQRLMPEDEWKASPYFRPDLDYDPRMTETRARALAEQRDAMKYRNWLSDRGSTGTLRGVLGFGAELVGSIPDPLNFIPFTGPAWRAAATARYGTIGGRALVGAAEAGIGQALIEPFSVADRVTLGEDVKFADVLFDLALGAAAGGVIGGGSGLIARLRGKGAEPILSVDQQRAAAQPLNEAAASIALGHDVAIRPETLEAVRPIRAEFEAAGRVLDAEERVRGLDPEERARLASALPETQRAAFQAAEARALAEPDRAAVHRAVADELLARGMAEPSAARMDTAMPRQELPDPTLREAARAVGKPETPAETGRRVLGEAVPKLPQDSATQLTEGLRGLLQENGAPARVVDTLIGPRPRQEAPEVTALRQAGRLTPDMEADIRAADMAATKAEAVADALDAAAACLVRAA